MFFQRNKIYKQGDYIACFVTVTLLSFEAMSNMLQYLHRIIITRSLRGNYALYI